MVLDRQKLVAFVKRQYMDGEDPRCDEFKVIHSVAGEAPNTVFSVPSKTEASAEDIASIIMERIHEDSAGLGGLQTYAVLAWKKQKGGGSVVERLAFRVRIEEDDEGNSFDVSEPPTKHGLVAQQMRHNEAILKTSVLGTGEIIRNYKDLIRELTEENRDLRKTEKEAWAMYKDMVLEKQRTDMELVKEANKIEMFRTTFEKANLLLPAIVNRLANRKVLPENATPESEMMATFMESLNQDQMGALQKILKPEQLVSVLEIYENVRKIKEAQAEKAKVNGAQAEPGKTGA